MGGRRARAELVIYAIVGVTMLAVVPASAVLAGAIVLLGGVVVRQVIIRTTGAPPDCGEPDDFRLSSMCPVSPLPLDRDAAALFRAQGRVSYPFDIVIEAP